MQPYGKISSRVPPKKLLPIEYHQSLTQSKDIFSEKQIMEVRSFEKKNNLGREIPFTSEITVAQKHIPAQNQETYEELFGYFHSSFLPFPLSGP